MAKLKGIGLGVLSAVLAFLCLLGLNLAQQTYQKVQAIDQILGYNLRVGRIVLPEAASPAPAPSPAPGRAPSPGAAAAPPAELPPAVPPKKP